MDDRLCHLVTQLRLRVDEHGGMYTLNTAGIFNLLSTLLFHEMGFIGNVEDHDDAGNWSIEQVLESRRGSPFSLAVLCDLLLMCTFHISTDIFDLPCRFQTHIIIGLHGGSQSFLDMRNGQVLSLQDCQRFVREQAPNFVLENNGEDWTPENNGALRDQDVLREMVRHILVCLNKAKVQSKTTRLHHAFEKNKALHRMTESAPNLLAIWCDRPHFLDTEVFQHYGLIDDAAMEMYQHGPWKDSIGRNGDW